MTQFFRRIMRPLLAVTTDSQPRAIQPPTGSTDMRDPQRREPQRLSLDRIEL